MDATDTRRRLLWHGILIVLLALVEGVGIQSFANPRMALSAHTGGIMTGLFTAVFGLIWLDIHLSPAAMRGLFWLTVFQGYVNFGGLVLAATFATRQSTPMHGGAQAAPAWQEALVTMTLSAGAVAILVCCVMALWGLRRPSPRARAGF